MSRYTCSSFMGRAVVCFLVAAIMAGCGASGATIGKVKGKVTAGGQPVTGGSLTFSPSATSKDSPASPASGTIQSDGTFTLTTRKEGDGAAVGKHRVTFTPSVEPTPDWDGYGTPPATPVSPFAGMRPSAEEVEVKAGDNEITIELVPGGGR